MTNVQTEAAIDQPIEYRLAPLRERIKALERTAQPLSTVGTPQEIKERAANAIRTFCRSLSPSAVRMSYGTERIYYAGISLDALSVAVALALSDTRPDREGGA